MEDKKWDLAALASIPLIMTLGNSMLIPILPQISQQLHVGPFQVSMLITVYAVVAILLIPIAGYLSDRYGRKTVIIPSLIIAAAKDTSCRYPNRKSSCAKSTAKRWSRSNAS